MKRKIIILVLVVLAVLTPVVVKHQVSVTAREAAARSLIIGAALGIDAQK